MFPSFHTRHRQLAFLQQQIRLLFFWPLIALIIAAAAWAALLDALAAEQEEAEAGAIGNAQLLAKAQARDLYRSLEAVDQITRYVKHGWEISGGGGALLDQATPFTLKPGFYVSIIDEGGNLLASTIPQANNVNIVNEPYFVAHRDAPDLFYIGTARLGNFSNSPVVPFSRRLSDRDGRFRGIVLVSVIPDYFMSEYDDLTLGKKGFLGIFSTDNILRLARVGDQVFLPATNVRTLTSQPEFTESAGSAVFHGNQWFVDKRSRYVAWESTEGYQMITMTGLDREDALAGFHAQRKAAIRNGVLASLALALFTALAMLVSLRLAWRKHQLTSTQATYRDATEGGGEGFFIVAGVGNARRAVDFRIADCNTQGADLLGCRREELINASLRRVLGGSLADMLIDIFNGALDTGHYQGEHEIAMGGKTRWIHLRVTRPAEDLAVAIRDITDIKSHLTALEQRGNEDALTGLPNRHWVNSFLPIAIEEADARHETMALLFIDLDGFKAVNDSMGHAAGDEILRNAARRLKDAVRPHDHVARIGGDEFLVILGKVEEGGDAGHVAERILDAFSPPFKVQQGVHSVGVSIGISLFPEDGEDADTLLNNADIAMYAVKSAGKRHYSYFDPHLSALLRSRHRLEADLRYALEHDQFVVYYQPRVDMATGKTASMEALIRWAHPTKGLIGPNDFIPLAEESGLIIGLGEQVVDKVCAQLASWSARRDKLVPVSINISAQHFHKADVAALLGSCVRRYRIDPRLIEIELTESCMIGDEIEVARTLQAIQDMGIKLLVDDFGTGYSSLSQLQRLDFDVLKVDRAFTAELDKSPEGAIFFTAIITMAHALGMRVVAEGVESLAQITKLRAMHCDEAQGFLISKPLPPSETQPILPAMAFASGPH